MIERVKREKLLLLGFLAAVAGFAFALWPIPQWTITPFSPENPVSEPEIARDSAAAKRLGAFFNHATLPPPAPPVEPPPDPAAALNRFRYLGNAAAGGRLRALFEGDGGVQSLRLGDALADFILMRVENGQALFVKDAIEVILPLSSP